jgi:hypothetical protein
MRTVTPWMMVPGLLACAALYFFAFWGRRQENGALLKTGLCADAEIIASSVTPFGERYRWTTVTYRFLPAGYTEPIEVTKSLDGVIDIAVGRIIPVRYLASHPSISILVPYAFKQSAS